MQYDRMLENVQTKVCKAKNILYLCPYVLHFHIS